MLAGASGDINFLAENNINYFDLGKNSFSHIKTTDYENPSSFLQSQDYY